MRRSGSVPLRRVCATDGGDRLRWVCSSLALLRFAVSTLRLHHPRTRATPPLGNVMANRRKYPCRNTAVQASERSREPGTAPDSSGPRDGTSRRRRSPAKPGSARRRPPGGERSAEFEARASSLRFEELEDHAIREARPIVISAARVVVIAPHHPDV